MSVNWSPEIGFGPNGIYQFPDADGVYVIAKITNGITEVRYVGQGNIYERMESHKNDDEPNSCLKIIMSDLSTIKVRSVLINNQTDRGNLEYTLWKHYANMGHKLCNKIPPPGQFIAGIAVPF